MQQLSGTQPFVTWDGLSGKPDAGETLDHIFVRQAKRTRFIRSSPCVAFSAPNRQQRLSDHMGIEAEISFNRNSGAAEQSAMVLSVSGLPVTGAGYREAAGGN